MCLNNKEIQILVLGVGGNVSQGIIKALRYSNLPMNIIGACIGEYSKGLYMCDEAYICPYAHEGKFIPWMIDFCNEHSIDIIFTGVEENILQLAKNEILLREKTKAVFISSSYQQLLIGQDKYLTCEFLKNSGCNYPRYQLWSEVESSKCFAKEIGYPIIAKPRNGKSSKGIHLLRSAEDIENHRNLKGYVLEEYLGNPDLEYTVGCYVDKSGCLQSLIPMQRKLHNGTTVWAKTVEDQVIVAECEKICRAFQPIGPMNIQMRLNKENKPVCFELNVRFSGTTSIRSRFGFQDVKAMILEYIYDEAIAECFQLRTGEVFRFDDELYLCNGTTDTMRQNRMIENVNEYAFHMGDNR